LKSRTYGVGKPVGRVHMLSKKTDDVLLVGQSVRRGGRGQFQRARGWDHLLVGRYHLVSDLRGVSCRHRNTLQLFIANTQTDRQTESLFTEPVTFQLNNIITAMAVRNGWQSPINAGHPQQRTYIINLRHRQK